MEKISCIYKIKNILNNKLYVGSTVDYTRRKRTHANNLAKNRHHSVYLQNAYNKYGKCNFIFEIIEICDRTKLIEREQYWYDNLDSQYSMMKNVQYHFGMKRSEETRRKISEANTGKICSPETREKLRDINKGKITDDITRQKISDGIKNSEKYRESIQRPERARKIKETRLSNGGYIVSEEMKINISNTLKSRKLQSAVSIQVDQYSLDGILLNIYPSLAKAEKNNDLHRGALSYQLNVLKRNEYRGFIWKQITK